MQLANLDRAWLPAWESAQAQMVTASVLRVGAGFDVLGVCVCPSVTVTRASCAPVRSAGIFCTLDHTGEKLWKRQWLIIAIYHPSFFAAVRPNSHSTRSVQRSGREHGCFYIFCVLSRFTYWNVYKFCLCKCPLESNSARSFYPWPPHTKQAFTIIWCLKLRLTKDKSGTFFTAGPPFHPSKKSLQFQADPGPFQYTVAMAITLGRPRVQSWKWSGWTWRGDSIHLPVSL